MSAALGTALLTSGLAVASPLFTPVATAAETLVDGGFEATTGDPSVSPGWAATDSEFDSPICNPDYCKEPPEGIGPHTGTSFAWFGGSDTAGHTASISQAVTLPAGTAIVEFWIAVPEASDSGVAATIDVTVDDTVVDHIGELDYTDTYEEVQVDISQYADGASHTLALSYENGDTGANSFVLDDISLDAVAGPVINANPDSLGPIPDAPECEDYIGGDPRDVTFTVAGKVGKATDVGVRMSFDPEHSYAGDLTVTLIAPDGRRAVVFGALGDFDDGSDLVGPYLFDDHAQESPTFEDAPVTDGVKDPGHYRPFQAGDDVLTPYFADLGNVNGTWTLRFRDLCDGDDGTVSAAALYHTPHRLASDADKDGVPDAADDCPAKAGTKPNGCPDTTAPDTDFLNAPANGISKSLRVPFGFVSDEVGATFLCSLDGLGFAPCANPTTLTVRAGRHTFRVAARDASGNVDPYPAVSSFTAYNCTALIGKVGTLTKALKAVKKAVKKTEAQLEKAQAAGDQAEVRKLEDKLTQLEKKQKKTAKKLAKAKTAAKPCTKAGTSSR